MTNIAGENVNVGTLNDRVALRGSVRTEADRITVAEIAVECSRLELVDNQITVTTAP